MPSFNHGDVRIAFLDEGRGRAHHPPPVCTQEGQTRSRAASPLGNCGGAGLERHLVIPGRRQRVRANARPDDRLRVGLGIHILAVTDSGFAPLISVHPTLGKLNWPKSPIADLGRRHPE